MSSNDIISEPYFENRAKGGSVWIDFKRHYLVSRAGGEISDYFHKNIICISWGNDKRDICFPTIFWWFPDSQIENCRFLGLVLNISMAALSHFTSMFDMLPMHSFGTHCCAYMTATSAVSCRHRMVMWSLQTVEVPKARHGLLWRSTTGSYVWKDQQNK